MQVVIFRNEKIDISNRNIIGDEMLPLYPQIRNCANTIINLCWEDFELKRSRTKTKRGRIYESSLKPFERTLQLAKTLCNIHTPKTITLSKESASERWKANLCIFPWCAKNIHLKGTCLHHYVYVYKVIVKQIPTWRQNIYPYQRSSRFIGKKRGRDEND